MRVTKNMLRERVATLNRLLHRQDDAWTVHAVTQAPLHSNPGHLMLDANSPGDGWTRYTLSVVVGENGGETNISPTLNAQEMWAYLQGVFAVLDTGYTHHFDIHTEKDGQPCSH